MKGYTVYAAEGCYEAHAVCVPVGHGADADGLSYKLFDVSQGQYLETSDEGDIAELVATCAATDKREAEQVSTGVAHLRAAPHSVAVVVATTPGGEHSPTGYRTIPKAATAAMLAGGERVTLLVRDGGAVWTYCGVTGERLTCVDAPTRPPVRRVEFRSIRQQSGRVECRAELFVGYEGGTGTAMSVDASDLRCILDMLHVDYSEVTR